ncbi:MAG: nitrous oxide reductase accessory protein NosL [Desulfobacteraceae bacterium]|jgi:nitrous oxide reductase accessory protein NosL|nr:nitrous oxide reductase accessory protein NosL [Desulfobacteraceae bacterium]
MRPFRQRLQIWVLGASLPLIFILWRPAMAQEPCEVAHPLAPAQEHYRGRCPNCGMARAMWARTWVSFENSNGPQSVCSLHCLADLALKSGESPRRVRVALYLEPKTMVPAETAVFVLGSRAKGTMTANSKPAFASAAAARSFAARCGGQSVDFAAALAAATADLPAENRVIGERRLATGKIVSPVDGQDECPVCQMFPARYPRHQCQVLVAGGRTRHFCSTQCLFTFLQNPGAYGQAAADDPLWAWVKDYESGEWISAETAYFVVGSRVLGPMGFEALPFSRRADAVSCSQKNGGQVLGFKAVQPDRLTPEKPAQ